MTENTSKLRYYLSEASGFAMLILGAVIAAFAIEAFLVPCTILDGGIVGISIMINNLSGISLGLMTLALNIPFLLVGMRKLVLNNPSPVGLRILSSSTCVGLRYGRLSIRQSFSRLWTSPTSLL